MSKRVHNLGKGQAPLVKAVHAGRIQQDDAALARLLVLRKPLTEWLNGLARDLFRPNPLIRDTVSLQTRAESLSRGSPWYAALAQSLAGNVAGRAASVESQLRTRILRWLMTCDGETPVRRVPGRKQAAAPEVPRRYIHVPVDVQDTVTPADLAAIKGLAGIDEGHRGEAIEGSASTKRPGRWLKLFADMRAAMLDAPGVSGTARAACREVACRHGLTPVRAAIVADICIRAFERYSCPVFARLGPNGTDAFVLRLELDAHVYADRRFQCKPDVFRQHINTAMDEAWAKGRQTFTWPLLFVDPENRSGHKVDPIALPITIRRNVWDLALRQANQARMPAIGNVSIEIGPDRVDLRVNVRLERRTPDIAATRPSQRNKLKDEDFAAIAEALNQRDVLLGRDIGLVNTLSLAAVRRDRAVTVEDLRAATFLSKEGALDRFLTHSHPAEPLAEDGKPLIARFSGRNFLDRIADHAQHIDRLRSHIDLNYETLRRLRQNLLKPLGLFDPAARIPDAYRSSPGRPAERVHPDPLVQRLVDKFFRILDLTLKLKEIRRDTYRRIAAVKRCWFGWLSSREAELALRLNAAVVREGTTYVAIPNDNPRYRGRTFNRLLANGARALYERMASHKLAWLGIPEVRVPSAYTSVADVRRSVVLKDNRKGETFVDADGVAWHADEHAALTVAAWLLLRPKEDCCGASAAAG